MPCSLVDRYERFAGTYGLHLQGGGVIFEVKSVTIKILDIFLNVNL
jgi:hypothetical protein